jgi:hypothetical protein
MYVKGQQRVEGFGEKTQRKETGWKTKAQMGGWDNNGSQRDWLGGL